MSISPVSSLRLNCDGCDASRLCDVGQNATEARAVAYADGWRFPNRITNDGVKVARRVSDVCPDCVSTWVPRVWKTRS